MDTNYYIVTELRYQSGSVVARLVGTVELLTILIEYLTVLLEYIDLFKPVTKHTKLLEMN